MNVIENFTELSVQEQKEFAEKLVATVNSEHTLSDEASFKILEVSADELTGDLVVDITNPDEELIAVKREASWTCGDEDETTNDPGYDAEYQESLTNDAAKALKTAAFEFEGYTINVDVYVVDEVETSEVIVDEYSHEDSGIGSYEYWGFHGHDSRPYLEVSGTLVKACGIGVSLVVSASKPAAEPETEED